MKGRILAVDPGTVRVGLAVSDPLGITAQPLEVVPAAQAVARITDICEELDVDEVIVGLPITEQGDEGESARMARELVGKLEESTGLPVKAVDERYTSRMAESTMVEAGVRRRRRRGSVDMVAAAVLLRGYLDSGERP
ncbi:MAG TPA: Holliday junction resolvase RuvX [Acidimicrobiia bacterium]|nr:Holliday junction resolvase RuvX [Acidimicrobiia bacterium]